MLLGLVACVSLSFDSHKPLYRKAKQQPFNFSSSKNCTYFSKRALKSENSRNPDLYVRNKCHLQLPCFSKLVHQIRGHQGQSLFSEDSMGYAWNLWSRMKKKVHVPTKQNQLQLPRLTNESWEFFNRSGINVDSLLTAADLDHTGRINYTEFVAACLYARFVQRGSLEDLLRSAFEALDSDRDGLIQVVLPLLGAFLVNQVRLGAIRCYLSVVQW